MAIIAPGIEYPKMVKKPSFFSKIDYYKSFYKVNEKSNKCN